MTREQIIARNNARRGLFVPSEEVSIYLWNGWRLLDDCPGFDHALLQAPAVFEPKAAA